MTPKCEKCGEAWAAVCIGCHGKGVDKSILAARRQIARVAERGLDKAAKEGAVSKAAVSDIMRALERAIRGGGPA